ncbi:MAG: hypothetical protein FWE06_06045 [Oscillospiraceae bacterium]|nr:hypothetical protein [Oscillospiraceae bacterium]
MADYKARYHHLAGRMETVIELLETTTNSLHSISKELVELTEKAKLAQQKTEELFINSQDESK